VGAALLCRLRLLSTRIVRALAGKWVKSNWKSAYCAVSSSGMFHMFEDQKASAPMMSVALRDCTVAAGDDECVR
jgi:hypothetical protein